MTAPAGGGLTPSAEQALQQLLAGNRRYAAGRPERPRQTPELRRALVDGQRPVAVVLGCADSRVSPEILFDQGLGDLFVVRLAGEVVDTAAIASLEYTAEHFSVPLMLVLGHSRCGAVTEACQATRSQPPQESTHLASLIAAIRPAVEEAEGLAGDRVDNAARIHVRRVVEQLRTCEPVLGRLAAEGKLRILGAF